MIDAKKILFIVALLAIACGVSFNGGVQHERITWELKWSEQVQKQEREHSAVVSKLIEEERAKFNRAQKEANDAQKLIDQIKTDAGAARAESDSLREQARRMAREAGTCSSDLVVTRTSKANAAALLAELFGEASDFAAGVAGAYEDARARGLACQSHHGLHVK